MHFICIFQFTIPFQFNIIPSNINHSAISFNYPY
ncbi:hypothetical protein F383_23429 [Gossypium arboreum]|uniref:Uncharacterized protein n=1 Tax=Gossypium arboreum TaxID=29729 RepID=A0A0B0P052_GOSAR|nr:hypothetical protein F383_23429 [Gossypium arboreum]